MITTDGVPWRGMSAVSNEGFVCLSPLVAGVHWCTLMLQLQNYSIGRWQKCILNIWCIYYMVWVIIGHCERYEVRVHNWSSHPWQVQLTGVRGGGPSSLPPLHAAQREKGRSVNECTPESHHLLPPPENPHKLCQTEISYNPSSNFSNSD